MFYFIKYKNYLTRRLFDFIMLFYKPAKRELEEYLEYCSENIEFYKNKGKTLEGYNYIDKKVLINDFDKFVNKSYKIKNIGLTSGTTGTPGKFFRDIISMASEQYFQNRYFNWKGSYMVFFRGERIFELDYKLDKIYRVIPFIKEMYISSYHINDNTLKNLVDKLKKIKKKSLWAYPSSAYELAEYCLRNNETLNFEIVALSSEMLMEYQREVIQKAFNCMVKDWYGQSERVAALGKCEYGSYHEIENYSHVEYMPAGENTYEIVGTTLHNKIMPIVKYNVHDLVEISPEPCLCGNKGRNIVKIYGRSSSYIELPNGRLHESPLAFLFKGMVNVIEAQVIQKKDKKIILKIVRAKDFSADNEKDLFAHISSIIPSELFSFEYVDRIERDNRGKFRYVINEGVV